MKTIARGEGGKKNEENKRKLKETKEN